MDAEDALAVLLVLRLRYPRLDEDAIAFPPARGQRPDREPPWPTYATRLTLERPLRGDCALVRTGVAEEIRGGNPETPSQAIKGDRSQTFGSIFD